MENSERKHLTPVDIDWTMKMSEDIAQYILEMKERDEIDGMFAPIMGVHIVAMVSKHMKANGFKLQYEGD